MKATIGILVNWWVFKVCQRNGRHDDIRSSNKLSVSAHDPTRITWRGVWSFGICQPKRFQVSFILIWKTIFTRFIRIDSSRWILARKKGDDKNMFRLPLKALAPKGDIESSYWYFGELDEQTTDDLLRSRDYPRGTFAVTVNERNNSFYTLSIINRVRTGMFSIF